MGLTQTPPPWEMPKVQVKDTSTRKQMRKHSGKLTSNWCECGQDEFLCYPQDGACPCGIQKHHVHCTCGGVSQIG